MNRLKSATLTFIQIALAWFAALILIRIFEVLLNGFSHEFPKGLPGFLFWSVVVDTVFWFKWLFFEYIIFVLFALVYPKLSKVLFLGVQSQNSHMNNGIARIKTRTISIFLLFNISRSV